MSNPWKDISLSDYEKHMSLDSVMQLQSMNQTMKSQFEDYDVNTVMILGIAGGNGLEHIDTEKYQAVYGVDINESYLQAVLDRYKNLDGMLKCLNLDIVNEADMLPEAELLIANLLIEYIGYDAFSNAVMKVNPQYVSCVIQMNETEKQWVSDSPYIHAFDRLDRVHCQMEKNKLTEKMNNIDYKLIKKSADVLPNGKRLIRLDYQK
ncbi:MAG: methyltransferase type 11 [Lachnospiraceae bacterium]